MPAQESKGKKKRKADREAIPEQPAETTVSTINCLDVLSATFRCADVWKESIHGANQPIIV